MLALRSKTRASAIGAARRFQSTTQHKTVIQHYKVPDIDHIDQTQKIPGLLSTKGLENAWYKRAQQHCQALNEEIDRTGLAPHQIEVLVQEYAKSPSKLQLFNNASILNNLEFFLKSLGGVRDVFDVDPIKVGEEELLKTPDLTTRSLPNAPTDQIFNDWVKSSFGSMIEFKTLLLNSANAINGDGFTWLVARRQKRPNIGDSALQKEEYDGLFVMNTYNAGTPNNSIRFGQITELRNKLKELENDLPQGTSTSSILSLIEAQDIASYADVEYKPILAIDASPKTWLHDYGAFGKTKYLETVWKAIDWDVVIRRLPARAPKSHISSLY